MVADVTRKATTKNVINGSIFPCPYGWFSSAGRFAYFKPNSTSREEKISVVDSIASAMSAYELPKNPATPLIKAKQVFPIMLKYVVRIAVCSLVIRFFRLHTTVGGMVSKGVRANYLSSCNDL